MFDGERGKRGFLRTTVPWNKFIVERFIENAMLTHEEEMVLRTRCAGWSIKKTAIELNMSESTVSRIIKRLRKKYDDVQWYDPMLPPRNVESKTDKLLDET